jgi:hypothetical protein
VGAIAASDWPTISTRPKAPLRNCAVDSSLTMSSAAALIVGFLRSGGK